MKNFEMARPISLKQASSLLGKDWKEARILAGGIDLLGEMKDHLIEPKRLVNLKSIDNLDFIEHKKGVLRIGALATLAEIAGHPAIRQYFTAISDAAGVVGSPQIRNVGTLGGNLCQRPRCWYYRDEHVHCLKKGGDRCYSVDGHNQYHAILGGGPCYIVHPSDLAPALLALGAQVKIASASQTREIPLEKFFVLPSADLYRENVLKPDEIVAEVSVPQPKPGTQSTYIKYREKESFDWALSACAVALTLKESVCQEARIVLGGVAPIPWHALAAEKALKGEQITEHLALEAASAALEGAEAMRDNSYKIALSQAIVQQAILKAAGKSG